MLDRQHLGLADYTCKRNAFGRQVRSFEADLEIPGIDGEPVRAVFIRAPWIDEHGNKVEVLADVDGHVVAARQDNMLVISFHPEIAGETRPTSCSRACGDERPPSPLRPSRRVARQQADKAGANAPRTGTGCPSAGGSRRAAWSAFEAHGIEVIVASTMRRAGDRAGHQRGARPGDRDRPRPARFLSVRRVLRRALRRHRLAELDAERAARLRRAGRRVVRRDAGPRDPRARADGDARRRRWILLVTHYGWLHFFLGHVLFGDDFGPQHLLGLWLAGHANTGISVFEAARGAWTGWTSPVGA